MRALLLPILIAACGSPATHPQPTTPLATTGPAIPHPTEPPLKETVLTADTPSTDTDGNAFVAPAEWKLGVKGNQTILTAPEGDTVIALVDIASADTADNAVSAAWMAFHPGLKLEILATEDAPDRDGWSRAKGFEYRTPPNAKRALAATALFANGHWLVVIDDIALGTAEKRASQFALVGSRLFPKGFTRESFAGRKAAKLDAGKLAELNKFVATAMVQTKVPGVSYGVIQDGKVIFSGGIGVGEVGKPGTVDGKTLYMIASNTKGLTTLMLAKLVDAKQLAWDQHVTEVLPQFKLGDAEVTKQVLVKHLICACTGLPRQDYEWLFEWKGATPESTLASLGTMMPTSKFGALFQYSNVMAAAGGYAGGHVKYPKLELGAAYDKAMAELVFQPLGMSATTFDYAKALRGNHAMPHGVDIDGVLVRDLMEPNYAIIPSRPAGAAWSNVDDMLKYVAMELAEGKLPTGKPYIGKEALFARRIPNVAIGEDRAYGMGLIMGKTWDVNVVSHGGDMIGFHSNMMWFPDLGVGAVILTNGDLGPIIRGGFQRKLVELMFDGAKPEADEDVAASAKAAFDGRAQERKLLELPPDAAATALLAKKYKSPALGEIAVGKTAAKTTFDFGEFKTDIATQKNQDKTVSYVTIAPGVQGFELVGVDRGAGKPIALVIRDGQHEYVFEPVQ